MQSCPSFATGSICAHVVAVSQKTGMMQPYLKWLVKSRRKTGKNFSEAVLQNIPAGRGRKGEKPLRKKERSQERPKIVVTRAGSAKNIDQAAQRIELSLHPSGTQNMLELANSLFTDSGQTIQQQTERSQLTSTSCFGNLLPPGPNATPFFPKPQRGQILIYLLPFCPKQTSVCWGCGNTLSNMLREWVDEGLLCNEVSNMYFYCNLQCVRKRQPYTDLRTFVITPEIRHFLLPTHRNYLAQSVGVLV